MPSETDLVNARCQIGLISGRHTPMADLNKYVGNRYTKETPDTFIYKKKLFVYLDISDDVTGQVNSKRTSVTIG